LANKDHSLDDKIIRAAYSEFLAYGFCKASLHKISEKAGVTTGAIYTRYKNKDALLRGSFGLEKTTEKQPCFGTVCETSTCQCCGGRADVQSTIYWCRQCNVPLYGNRCSRCGMEAKKLTTDVRPVFPEERLLIEIILQKPFEFLKKSVWNGTGNHYFVDV